MSPVVFASVLFSVLFADSVPGIVCCPDRLVDLRAGAVAGILVLQERVVFVRLAL